MTPHPTVLSSAQLISKIIATQKYAVAYFATAVNYTRKKVYNFGHRCQSIYAHFSSSLTLHTKHRPYTGCGIACEFWTKFAIDQHSRLLYMTTIRGKWKNHLHKLLPMKLNFFSICTDASFLQISLTICHRKYFFQDSIILVSKVSVRKDIIFYWENNI